MTVSSQIEPPLLEMRGVGKHYRGVAALKDMDFDLRRGEVHAILGENGAGKSTLVKILAGAVTPTQGEILIDGQRIQIASPSLARRYGIAMVYQETSLVPSMTVAQNLYLGDEKFFNRLRGTYIDAQQFLQSLNFPVDPTATVQSLGTAKRQMVEIARAVRLKAKVIIFDEPTATLTPEEKHHLFALIDRLRKDRVSIIFISHALEEALEISDRITILRDGAHVVTDDARSFTRETIIRHMVGRSLTDELYGRAGERATRRPPGAKVLSVQNLSMQNQVRNTSFSIFAGQVTGVFGLVGSAGRRRRGSSPASSSATPFMAATSGWAIDPCVTGRLAPRSATASSMSPRIAKATGSSRPCRSRTTSMSDRSRAANRVGFSPDEAKSRRLPHDWTKRLNIRALSGDARVIELSGGNQQKVVIAKSLVQNPKLIIFDEPTRGVDVGAIAEIHHLIGALADDGLAVVVISSYLPGDPEPVGSHSGFEAGPNCRGAFAGRGDLRGGHVRGGILRPGRLGP